MKMNDDDLLSFLEAEQASAYQHTSTELSRDRAQAMRDYVRAPYGNEEEGRSQVVSSDVFDAIEGMLPDLLEVFTATDKAVVFEPMGPEDEQGAEQATDACNHVFYKQNNGFFVLYEAAKDALHLKTGGVKWWWDESRRVNFQTYTTDEMQLAAWLISNPDAQVVEQEDVEPDPQMVQMAMAQGIQPPRRLKVKVKTLEKKGRVKVAAIPPDELQVSSRHGSVLLDECPYVAHVCERTLSDIRQMGYDVDADDVRAAQGEQPTEDRDTINQLTGRWDEDDNDADPAQVRGWLREEYVLVDYDGDGIAERRRIVRLGKKVLENRETGHVQIAAWTPYVLTHRFHGISVADLVSDLQKISTDIWRQQLDNLYLANNQETVVLTDAQGNPLADLDDLLNRRPGGILRERAQGAIRPYAERWQGVEALPMIEQVSSARENRTGWTRYSQGLDSDSLNKTATGITKIMNASQKRMKLMARIMAEALVAPMFRGIFKTLTDYCMEPLAFRLKGQFVQYDPQEWRDGYDMSINVGIGTGDNMEQMQYLQQIAGAQMQLMGSPMGGRVVTEINVFNTLARIAEKAGFKNPAEFWTDPSQLPPPQPQPTPEMMRAQADMQAKQAELQIKGQQAQADMARDQQSAQIELEKARVELQIKTAELEIKRQALQLKAEEAVMDAQLAQQRAAMHASDDMARAQEIRSR